MSEACGSTWRTLVLSIACSVRPGSWVRFHPTPHSGLVCDIFRLTERNRKLFGVAASCHDQRRGQDLHGVWGTAKSLSSAPLISGPSHIALSLMRSHTTPITGS